MPRGAIAPSKLLSQVGSISLTGQPTQPQGYPAKAAVPKAQPATAIRPYRAGLSGRNMKAAIPQIPTIKWK